MPREPAVKPLHEVLARLPMPDGCRTVAKKWRCIEVPFAEEDGDMLYWFDRGIPVLVPKERGAPVHEACGGDGIEFVTNPSWDAFPKPKIAFRGGWAGPGTEFEQEEFHELITSFSDVAKHDEKARQAGGTEQQQAAAAAATVDPAKEAVPPHGPAQATRKPVKDILNLQFFHRVDKESHPSIPNLSELLLWPPCLEDGAVCDNATRVSETGAVTWWHLDDSGEFVMQTGLPDRKHPDSKHIVKVFLYGPPDSYDWFMHDHASEECGKIVALDIFNMTDEQLPPAEHLPIIRVAALEAGGRPLISPPNIPHIVITTNKCVMIEQRRISNIFLDEVGYFMQKVKHWKNDPIVYDYVRTQLQEDEAFVHTLVGMLVRSHNDAAAGSIVRKRCAVSLYAIAAFPLVFKLPEDARESLKNLLRDPSSPLAETLTSQTIDRVVWHFDVTRHWELAGEVFNVGPGQHCGVIYENYCPVYGPPRADREMAMADRVRMLHAQKHGILHTFLTRANGDVKDDVLDELF